MIKPVRVPFLCTGLVLAPIVASAQPVLQGVTPVAASAGPALPYADLADLVLAAPVIADGTIRSATRIKGAEAAGVAAGNARFYITADLTALLRGTGGIAPRVGYLVDVPLDPRGRVPRLRKQRVLIFARPAGAATDQLQLVAADAQLEWSPATDAAVRRIAADVVRADATPAIAGIGNAFHVPGALPGEGETQVFLKTVNDRPVSLTVLRRPGEQPRWAVALSEVVDEAAGPPARDTLLWYRLACGLPRQLPSAAIAALEPADAARATEDYQFVLSALGPCGRTRRGA